MICVYSLQRVCPQEVLCLCVIHFEDLFQTQACVLDGQTVTTSGAEKAAYQGLRSMKPTVVPHNSPLTKQKQ